MRKGDRVKLSAEGLAAFGRRSMGFAGKVQRRIHSPADRRGTVTSTSFDAPQLTPGCIRVRWDGLNQPETVNEYFVEMLEKSSGVAA